MTNVINLSTGYISSQFHLVFDDLFETVICTKDDESVLNAICNDLFELNKDWYYEDEHDDNGKFIYQPPPLEDNWIDEQGRCNCRNALYNQSKRREDCICEKNHAVPDIIPLTEDNYARPPTGYPISNDKSIVDVLLGIPPTY